MATKPSNRSGSEVQGAFGDAERQDTEGIGQTKYDKSSTLNLKGEKELPQASEIQAPNDPVNDDTGH